MTLKVNLAKLEGVMIIDNINRSKSKKSSNKFNYYVTPPKEIEKFLKVFLQIEYLPKHIKILDPAAGGDANHLMSYPETLKKFGFYGIDTIDIRSDSLAKFKTDYLQVDCKEKYDLIITNPPFNLALEFIKKALYEVKQNGWVIMLLRLNFFGSQARFNFWKNNMPKYCFVHHKRISFTDDGKTDASEYCHMCWLKGYNPKFTQLMVI